MKGKHFKVNVILVSVEDFTPSDYDKVLYALQFTRDIYAKVNLGIGKINWCQIIKSQAGSKATINSRSEAKELTEDYTVYNDALDLFVVRVFKGSAGWSATDGPCDKDEKGFTGSVVSLNGDKDYVGNTFAHEIGHYLGLNEVDDNGNFIHGKSNSWTGIYSWQGNIMKNHCFVLSGCP
jgi:hypothetical protein